VRDRPIPGVPALRWDDETGYGLRSPGVARRLADGVLGFILFGGPAAAVRAATAELRERAGRPLLFGADLERGAGQQFDGATPLPPLAALASLDDESVLEAAGALTAREAVALGVSWIFAPVADLALEPRNPIVGTRSPGADPDRVAKAVAAWIRGCRAGGGIPCVKHFPGHGRTTEDSHRALPVVSTDAGTLRDTDLLPFRAALAAGVPSVMTAHVAYPALDPEGRAATRSRRIVHDLLRLEMGFEGVVVTDALIMEGAGSPEAAMAEALAAGVDVLLYPPEGLDPGAALGLAAETLDPEEAAASAERVRRLVAAGSMGPSDEPVGTPEDRARVLDWAQRTLRVVGGGPVSGDVVLTVVDDDRGGPFPAPSRAPFTDALRTAGFRVQEAGEGEGRGTPVLCLYAEPRGWKGRAGLSPEARGALGRWAERHGTSGRILVFGGPGLLEELPSGIPTILAWGGEALMQEAAARSLAGETGAAGTSAS
jgi:beta-glucosidase-like glycosyl hydrolase